MIFFLDFKKITTKKDTSILLKNLENEKQNFFKLNQNLNINKNIQKKLLIIGDSHSVNIYNALDINNLNNQFSLSRRDFPAFCFYPKDRRTLIVKLFNYDDEYYNCNKKIDNLIHSKEFISADYVLIANRWSIDDVNLLENNLDYFSKTFYNKKIIIIGQNAIFKKFDIVLYKYGIDEKVNTIFFNLLNPNDVQINYKLKKISKDADIAYFDRLNLVCNFDKKTCNVVMLKKILYLDDNHWSINGSRFYGEMIFLLMSSLL